MTPLFTCASMVGVGSAPSLSWTVQDHFRGLPNMFGSLCCNSWGRALSELTFIEAAALVLRTVLSPPFRKHSNLSARNVPSSLSTELITKLDDHEEQEGP